MTCIGVSTYQFDNPKDVTVPSYSYQFPMGRRVQLVAVKEGIYHPRLPTIRQLERDWTLHKLPDEHCRTSLPVEAATGFKDFKRATTVDPAALRTRHRNIDDEGRDIRYEYTPDELKKAREDWSKFLDKCPERFQIRLTEHPDTANTPFTGYAMRYLKPEVTAKWRYTLRQEPMMDMHGQRPMPADALNRYRNVHTRTAASVSTDPYRPPYKNHFFHM